MFTFHHVNAFQVPAPSGTNGSNGNGSSNGSSGRQLLVLDTVGWDKISFENSQHNLTTEYYKGEPVGTDVCMFAALSLSTDVCMLAALVLALFPHAARMVSCCPVCCGVLECAT